MVLFYDDIKRRLPATFKMICGLAAKEQHGKTFYWKIGAGFDCETTRTEKGYSYVYAWQFSLNQYEIIGRRTEDCETFLRELDDYLFKLDRMKNRNKVKEHTKLLIFDANMGYEFAHFKRIFGRIGITSVFAKDKRHPLKLGVGRCLEFRECLGVFGYSLANIADTYTKTKKRVGDLDYSKQRNSLTPLLPEEIGYMQNDVAILSELCFIAFDLFPSAIPLTGTGIIRDAVKQRLKKQGKMSLEFAKERVAKLMPRTLADYNVMMDYLYCGGWSHSYFPAVQHEMKSVRCADLVSDFPAQMFQHSFPAGTLLYNCSVEDTQRYRHWYALFTFYDVHTKYDHSYISEHKCIDLCGAVMDNGRVHRAQMLSVYLNEVDYNNFCTLHTFDETKTEIKDIHCFTRSEPVMSALLETLKEQYRKKNQLKADGKSKTREYAESKKFVNGCYGMTATRIYLENVVINEQGDDLKSIDVMRPYDHLIADIIKDKNMKGCTTPEEIQKELHEAYQTDIYDHLAEDIEKCDIIRPKTLLNWIVSEAAAWDEVKQKHAETLIRSLHKVVADRMYKELIKNLWLSPWIAVYTTSYAREILVFFVSEYPDLIVQYDTDSIYYRTDQPLSKELEKDIDAFNSWKAATNNRIFDNDPFFETLGTWEKDPISERFKCLGAKRYIKQTDGKIKCVCAGMKEKAFLQYCEKEQLDPFEFFGHKMYLFPEDSGKTTLKYHDKKEGYDETIIDEYGNTENVHIESCATIEEIPFGLYMSGVWLEFLRFQQERMKKL